ncbi:MAG: dienelactone hydrolase family protein, partial [Pseudomonadota bacterium]|nr:dienelactone hydrolase family protein [Pseudomonadota bacterium]
MSEKVDYFDNDVRLEGVLFPTDNPDSSPLVLVVPSYAGRDDFTLEKAQMMNELGYSGFAVDMYGEGKIGSSPEENMELMQAVLDDRELLQRRINLAHKTAIEKVGIDASKSGAIGFCFGGL